MTQWQAVLSATRTWIGGHPDRRINSHIWVSTDPPDRHLPVSAACVRGKSSSDTLAVQSYPCILCG
ncbi:MAG: hypothetical protein ACOYCD_00770 [Kiritimatiellia bacterium]